MKTVSCDSEGRYTIRLPFRKRLGESQKMALKRLRSVEYKLDANTDLKLEYTRVLKEYLKSNYISLVEDPKNDSYYMPHYVIEEASSIIKVVHQIPLAWYLMHQPKQVVALNDLLLVRLII